MNGKVSSALAYKDLLTPFSSIVHVLLQRYQYLGLPENPAMSQSVCSLTETRRLTDRDSEYEYRGALAVYVKHFHANKTGFFLLCLFSMLIMVAILFVVLASTRPSKLEKYQRTMKDRAIHEMEKVTSTSTEKAHNERSQKSYSFSDNIDELNKICKFRTGKCSYHERLARANCTHLTCISVKLNISYDSKNNKLSLLQVSKSTILAIPASDGQRCIYQNSFGRCLEEKCVVDRESIVNNETMAKQQIEVRNDKSLLTCRLSILQASCKNTVGSRFSLLELLPWVKYASCDITDRRSLCTSHPFRVRLALENFYYSKPYRFNETTTPFETLLIQLTKCKNACPESKTFDFPTCTQVMICQYRHGVSKTDFSVCCLFDRAKRKYDFGRCLAGLCLQVVADYL
uniref:Uncharacterized protein n=1 Tax=Romanomermis culicivorax TaxID=13658 RepID=A0A915LDD6_ROMCU